MDIAICHLEIGGLVFDKEWQKFGKIRIFFGNDVNRRTKDVIDKAVEVLLSINKG